MEERHVVLSSIATIDAGLSFRSRVEDSATGSLKIVQQKDLSEDTATVDTTNLYTISPPPRLDLAKYGLKDGDIIIRTRGNKPLATIVRDLPGTAIAAAPLVRVRISSEAVLADYLVWFLNSQKAAEYFVRNAKGSGVKLIDKATIAGISIPALSMGRQNAIAEVFMLANTEFMLSQSLSKRHRQLREDQINMIANGVEYD